MVCGEVTLQYTNYAVNLIFKEAPPAPMYPAMPDSISTWSICNRSAYKPTHPCCAELHYRCLQSVIINQLANVDGLTRYRLYMAKRQNILALLEQLADEMTPRKSAWKYCKW